MWLVNLKRAVVLFLIALSLLPYLYYESYQRYSFKMAKLQKIFNNVSGKLKTMQLKHGRLVTRVQKSERFRELIDDKDELLSDYPAPTLEYEKLRWRIYSNTQEMWYYINHQLGTMSESLTAEKMKTILDEVKYRIRLLISEQDKLFSLDGYESWRKQEAASLTSLVQRRLHHLQNPRDCRAQRKLVCDLESHDPGWQFRHLVLCLTHAYASERTLVVTHSHSMWWSSTFQPLSETCTRLYNDTIQIEPELVSVFKDAKVIKYMPQSSWVVKKKEIDLDNNFKAASIPKDLIHRIKRINGDAASWWIGQMFKYIFKIEKDEQNNIDQRIKTITSGAKPPIVGLVIHRTFLSPFLNGAECRSVEEYMSHVVDYFEQQELTRTVYQRQVYLATDDFTVIEEFTKKYPQYTFYARYSYAQRKTAQKIFSRTYLADLPLDLRMLMSCDHVVLTLNSIIGRMAYMSMQSNLMDASKHFSAVDPHYISDTDQHFRIAVVQHKGGPYDIVFDIGDLIDVRIHYLNGTGQGTSIKSNISGLFPWYKTNEYLEWYVFPEYEQVPTEGLTNVP